MGGRTDGWNEKKNKRGNNMYTYLRLTTTQITINVMVTAAITATLMMMALTANKQTRQKLVTITGIKLDC